MQNFWQDGLSALVHWLHLMGAILWIGGMLFAGWMLTPAERGAVPPEVRAAIFNKVGKRFYIIAWSALLVSIATGIYKVFALRGVPGLFQSSFGAILIIKLSLAAVMITLSFLHDFIWRPRLAARSGHAASGEHRGLDFWVPLWRHVNAAAAVLIVLLGAFLR